MTKIGKMLIVIVLLVLFGIFFYFILKKDDVVVPISPVVVTPNQATLCFYNEIKTDRGLYDIAWTRLNIVGDKVSGEFRNLPAEKDSKTGTFSGVVGAVDKTMMARTADVWWDSMAEGMQVKEQLKIVFGEGTAQALFGEMVDRGDGVYVYKDPIKLTYGVAMSDVACTDLYIVGRSCYEYNHTATIDSPYTVKEKIDITRHGVSITGKKSGTQSGPDMTNGYAGTLVGSLEGDLFSPLFSYVVEGSAQKEKEIYQVKDGLLVKRRYTLKEENKVLVPDLSTKYNELIYNKVSCSTL